MACCGIHFGAKFSMTCEICLCAKCSMKCCEIYCVKISMKARKKLVETNRNDYPQKLR